MTKNKHATVAQDHYVSLKLAKRLYEAGFFDDYDPHIDGKGGKEAMNVWGSWDGEGDEYHYTPLATELLDRIRLGYNVSFSLKINKHVVSFHAHGISSVPIFKARTLPDALAKLWLWLKENEHL